MSVKNPNGEITGTTKVSFSLAQTGAILSALGGMAWIGFKALLAFTAMETELSALRADMGRKITEDQQFHATEVAARHEVERRMWSISDMWTWVLEARAANQKTAAQFPEPHKVQ